MIFQIQLGNINVDRVCVCNWPHLALFDPLLSTLLLVHGYYRQGAHAGLKSP